MVSSLLDLLKQRRVLVPVLALVLALILPPLATALDETFYITLSSRILIFALAAVSLDLIIGYGGMASLGHGAFFGIGGYVVGILAFHASEETAIPFLPFDWNGSFEGMIAFSLAILVAGLLAAIIGALSLRTSNVYFIMITLAFGQMLFFFFISLTYYGGEDGINLVQRNTIMGGDVSSYTAFYYVCLAALLGFLWLSHQLVRSRFGMIVRGIKQNESRMKSLGYSAYWYKLVMFIIAGAGAGLAGALAANQSEFIDPGLMHWSKSGELMVMVILGGMGTLIGPVFGAAALLLMEEVLSSYTEHWMVFLGPLLIGIVLFAKRGVYGWLIGPDTGDDKAGREGDER